MDYQKMLEEKKRLLAGAGEGKRQEIMEHSMRLLVETQDHGVQIIHDMMKKSFVSCSEADQTLSLLYDVEPWELNSSDTMHGGLIGTAIDTTCGMLVRYLSDSPNSVTMSMTVNYLRPVPKGSKLLVKVSAAKMGKTVANLTAEAFVVPGEKTAATATVVFMILK